MENIIETTEKEAELNAKIKLLMDYIRKITGKENADEDKIYQMIGESLPEQPEQHPDRVYLE